MSYRVIITPGDRTFMAEAGEVLLDAALRQGIELPYGCRDGACGACKGRIVEGAVGHGRMQALAETEKAAGMALFCCATAASDLTVEIKVVGGGEFPVKTLPARVETLRRLAPDVIELGLRLPSSERLHFRAGQYIDILLKDGGRRSFSLASAPGAADLLYLHIGHVPGGLFTGQVFSTLKTRDLLRFSGPHGGFYLHEEAEKPAILLAGGTGFAPVKAMIEQALANGCRRQLHLYRGARDLSALYLPELPMQWAAAGQVRYVAVLSGPLPGDNWTGRTGLVHRAVVEDFPDLSGFQIYACGAPAMIEAARADYAAAGLPADEFFADAFTFAGQPD